jgi:outer membrane protein OmpA-like peptidoglycan-associated protein
MKRTLAISTLVAASATVAVPNALAEEKSGGLKHFGASSLALASGVAIGGPAGLVLGGIGAIVMGNQITETRRAHMAEKNQTRTEQDFRLTEAPLPLTESEPNLQQTRAEILKEFAQDGAQIHVYFHSGKDDLTPRDMEQINRLAEALREQPELHIKLIGFADARGTEGYNQVLSEYRTRNVKDYLVRAGVTAERIQRQAFGANFSALHYGDEGDYARDRYVAIEIFSPQDAPEGIVKAH